MSLWGAGFIGPDGTDYVAAEADAIRGHMGRGLYSQDAHGTMGQWRDLVAVPLALLRNLIDWIAYNANPGRAIDLLPYWEAVLGLHHHAGRLTVAERQQCCKERLRRWASLPGAPPGVPDHAGFPTATNVKELLYTLHIRALGVEPVDWVKTPGVPIWTLRCEPEMFDPSNANWLAEIQHMRDALCPAYGQIVIGT